MIQPLYTSLAAPSRPRASRRQAPSIRLGSRLRKPWVAATGTPSIRHGKAIFYLVKAFKYKDAWLLDTAEASLAKVVCNLRHYYRQDQEATVELVQKYFNPRSVHDWSPEAIRLTWECVACFTPSLGIRDVKARAKQKAQRLETEVIDLLIWTKSGGRVLDDDLLRVFRKWNPSMRVTSNAFTRAISAVTGMSKRRSNGKAYWVGFCLPTAAELARPVTKAA